MDDKSLPEMEAKNNKETINLLDFLSESESDVSDIVIAPKKKKVKRRYRSGGAYSVKEKRGDSCGCGKSQTRAVVLWLAAVSITFWLLALSWLAAILYSDIRKMDSNIRSVVAGNADVPNTLQQYHSLSKDLQNNQTIILANITEIKLQIANFTIQLTSIQRGLHEVQETIRAAPELVNIPNKLKDLSTEVSTLGSKITDILSTTNESRETHRRIESWHSNMVNNITTIEQKLSDLSNISQKPQAVFYNESKAQNEFFNSTIAEIRDNLTTVNNTLTRNLLSTKNNEDNLLEYKKRLVQFDETTHNLTARVGSLDGECAKITAQDEIKLIVDKLTAEMNSLKYNDTKLKSQIEALENSYNSMQVSISGLQNYQKSYNTTVQNNEDITAILSEGGKTVSKDTELVTESSNGLIKESGIEISNKDKTDTAELKAPEIDPTT